MHALGVVGVVHRVGLGHALDEPELELVALGEPELLELAHAELDERVVVHLPHLVAREAEELEPHAGLAGIGDHPRAPGAEVLDAADVHVRVVDVDPVVREQVLPVQHHGNGEEVPVAQAAGGGHDLGRGCGSAMPTVFRSGSDEITAEARNQAVAHVHTGAAVTGELELRGAVVQQHLAAELLDVHGHLLPHLARAVAGVVELRDQAGDLVAAVAEESAPGGPEEREVLDALRGPVGTDLGRGHAPDLLGVRLEELVEQIAAEAVRDPLLVGVLLALGLDRGPDVGRAPYRDRSGRAS